MINLLQPKEYQHYCECTRCPCTALTISWLRLGNGQRLYICGTCFYDEWHDTDFDAEYEKEWVEAVSKLREVRQAIKEANE